MQSFSHSILLFVSGKMVYRYIFITYTHIYIHTHSRSQVIGHRVPNSFAPFLSKFFRQGTERHDTGEII